VAMQERRDVIRSREIGRVRSCERRPRALRPSL